MTMVLRTVMRVPHWASMSLLREIFADERKREITGTVPVIAGYPLTSDSA